MTRMRIRAPALHKLAAALVVASVCVLANATVVLEAGVTELADECALAVLGRVRGVDTVLERRPLRVWTEIDLEVEETLLGTATERITISVPGGTAGGLSQDVHGTARVATGERAVFFLWKEGDRHRVLGMSQGCLHVRTVGGKDVCRADVRHLTVVRRERPATASKHGPIPLADVRREVHDAVKRRAEAEERKRKRIAARLARARESAERNAERTRGRPGGSQ